MVSRKTIINVALHTRQSILTIYTFISKLFCMQWLSLCCVVLSLVLMLTFLAILGTFLYHLMDFILQVSCQMEFQNAYCFCCIEKSYSYIHPPYIPTYLANIFTADWGASIFSSFYPLSGKHMLLDLYKCTKQINFVSFLLCFVNF